MRITVISVLLLISSGLSAQNYTSFFTGDVNDVAPPALGGLVLMGGATENDQAMQWFLEKANGGDVLVIRASGSDGYNDYLYTDLGIDVNSVETIVLNNADAANDSYVIQQIENAEALWIAGGNQWTYINEWRNEGVEDAINYLLNEKGAVVGGTSAGMAVLGGVYFTAQNGTIQSGTALSNPFHSGVQLGYNDFLIAPFMENVVTDQHYNNPDRKGRHVTFMARMEFDTGERSFGIASDEYTAVCIEPDGTARAFGDYPEYQDFVYFLQSNCTEAGPEVIQPGVSLTWNRGEKAIQVYKVPASNSGVNTFNLNDWQSGEGGDWQYWWVSDGELFEDEQGDVPNCVTSTVEQSSPSFSIWPTLTASYVQVVVDMPRWNWNVISLGGQIVRSGESLNSAGQIDISMLSSGIYVFEIIAEDEVHRQKIVRR